MPKASSSICILKNGCAQSAFEGVTMCFFKWLSILVYPVESIGFLRIIEYFNAIKIHDNLFHVAPGPGDEQSSQGKTLGSSNDDCHLHGAWWLAGHLMIFPFSEASNMPPGNICFFFYLTGFREVEQVAFSLVVSHWSTPNPWSSKCRAWLPLTWLSLHYE